MTSVRFEGPPIRRPGRLYVSLVGPVVASPLNVEPITREPSRESETDDESHCVLVWLAPGAVRP